MKKLLIFAMAALAFVACKPQQEQPDQTKLSLNESEITVKKDATFQLTANLDVTWTSANEKVATVSAGLVKGIAKGETTVTAESKDGQKAACKVIVTDDGEENPPVDVDTYKDFAQLQGSAYYVLFLQEGAMKYLGNKVLYYFGPNDHMDEAAGKNQGSRWLYIWNHPAESGGTAVGTDPFDMAEGWTCIKQVEGWCAGGLCIGITGDNNVSGEGAAEDLAALSDIQNHITNYDEWYLAIALKNTVQGAAYDFELIGSNVDNVESGKGKINIAPAATGEWVYKEYKLSEIQGLEFGNFNHNGSNFFTFSANPFLANTQLDLGYVFIYKK
ncbi:MAG: Ig-like domain-containing protein [Paludibacteraceae bacterium]|nr:Ig-like domain-containing protein [Paludibacteraceae bacterium]